MFSKIVIIGSLSAFVFIVAPIAGNSLGLIHTSAEAAQKSKSAKKRSMSKKGTYRNDSTGVPVYRRGF